MNGHAEDTASGDNEKTDEAVLLRDDLKLYLPGAVLVILAFVLAYQFVEPAPPSTIRMATGAEDGGYAAFAHQYRAALAKVGVELETVTTGGSVENLELLENGEVRLGFVQGGVAPPEGTELLSLGGVFLEPGWLFVRDPAVQRLSDLQGQRIAIGPEGSGTRKLALRLLADNGVTMENSALLPLPGAEAAAALINGEIDAAIFIVSERSPLIRELLADEGSRLVSFERAGAYQQRYRFVRPVILHEGAIDLENNFPGSDTRLLAASASLVVHPDLHPALVDLLMQVARSVHRRGGLFEAPDAYPSPEGSDLPLHPHARKFYDRGPPFLQRYMPFWAATLVDRMAVMLVPFLTLLLPLARILPPALDWRVRSRVYRWYDDLRKVELDADGTLDAARLSALQQRLDELESQVSGISVPTTRTNIVYTLREHIALIRARLNHIGEKVG